MSTPPMPMVQVFAPDGTLGDIPYDKLHDALGAGAKIAAKVKAPDGTVGFVPGDRVPDALKAGGQRVPLDGNDADGGKPGFWSRALGLKQGATSDQFLDQMGQSNIAAAKFGADTMAGTTLAGPAAKLFNTEALPALKAVPFLGKAVSAIDEAPGVLGKIVRGASVGGTSGGVEAAIRGKKPEEIAKEAGYGALTGGALGAAIPLAEHLSPLPAEAVAQEQLASDAAAMRTRNLQARVAESKAAEATGQTVPEYRAAQKTAAKASATAKLSDLAGVQPSGVTVVPEPGPLFPGQNSNYMASVPRGTLQDLALAGKPGAGTQIQQLGGKILYAPSGAGISNVKSAVALRDLLEAKPSMTLNPVGAGGARPIVSPESQFESSFGPEHQEVGDLAEWETGNRQGVKVGSDLDQAAKSMFGGKSFDTLTPEQKAHILRIAQTQVVVP